MFAPPPRPAHAYTRTHTLERVCLSRAGVQAIVGGWYHSLALKSDGTVWGAGYNQFGQLGDGTNTGRLTFVQALGISGL